MEHVISSVLMYAKRWDVVGDWRPTGCNVSDTKRPRGSTCVTLKNAKICIGSPDLIINAVLMYLRFHFIWSFRDGWLDVREKIQVSICDIFESFFSCLTAYILFRKCKFLHFKNISLGKL